MLTGFWSTVKSVTGTAIKAAVYPPAAPLIIAKAFRSGSATPSTTYAAPVTALTVPGAPPTALARQVSAAANLLSTMTPLASSGAMSPPPNAVNPQTIAAASQALGGSGAPSPSMTFDQGGVPVPASVPVGLLGKFGALSMPMKVAVVGGIGAAVYFGAKMLKGGAAGHAPKSEGA